MLSVKQMFASCLKLTVLCTFSLLYDVWFILHKGCARSLDCSLGDVHSSWQLHIANFYKWFAWKFRCFVSSCLRPNKYCWHYVQNSVYRTTETMNLVSFLWKWYGTSLSKLCLKRARYFPSLISAKSFCKQEKMHYLRYHKWLQDGNNTWNISLV